MRQLPVVLTAAMLTAFGIAAPSSAQEGFDAVRGQCIACHGENGVSDTPDTPSLGGIDDYYALLQLVAFRSGNRRNELMNDIVADMSDNDLRAAAAWIASLPRPPAPEEAGDPEKMKRGAELVPANRCNACHGVQLLGGHQMPPLRNQREDYLLKALGDYKAERRFGDRAAMVEITTPIADEDLAVLAHYLAHLRE
ncbi:MAG: c-type cytochrome [Oricola sp.]